jgi:hypothetical protein
LQQRVTVANRGEYWRQSGAFARRRHGEESKFLNRFPRFLRVDAFAHQVTRLALGASHSIHRRRQAEARIVERQAIHDLIVVVARRFLLRAGK